MTKDNVQEPFAWCVDSENSADWAIAKTKEGVEINAKLMDADCIRTAPFPLYITPLAAQRQWVGLTDEEIEQEFGFIDELLRDCVQRTEAKLKEKNA